MPLSIYPAPWPRPPIRDVDEPVVRSTTVWPRADRRTKSCTECQRRKQKCNKLQPCNHCKRRFPEPVCEYGPLRSATAPRQVISTSPRPLLAFPVSLPASTPRAFHFRKQARPLAQKSPNRQRAPRAPPTQKRAQQREASQRRKIVASWSDLGVVTEYPVCSDSEDDFSPENASRDATYTEVFEEANPQAQASSQTQTALLHQPRQHSQARGLQQYNAPTATSHTSSPWQLAGPLDAMGGLPIVVNKQNAMLIHTFGEVLYHLKGTFDGVPDDDNPFIEHYVPWCVQSPLLVHTSLYISAQPLAERHFLDETTTMRIKVNAIHVLNEYLRSADTAVCTGDEAMGAVAQFISIELYYGTPAAMQAHLHGLRQMVQLRGAFSHSRVGALVSKVALVGDCIIAVSLEVEPILQTTPAFQHAYDEPPPPTFNLSFSSPLLAPRLPFGVCIASLGLHPAAAWLLDEMAFLINVVLSLPADGPTSEQELAKLRATAAWTLARIEELPVDSPDAAVVVEEVTVKADLNAASTDSSPPDAPAAAESHSPGSGLPRPHSLLPRYPKFSSEHPSSSSPSLHPPTSTSATGLPLAQYPPAGPLYTVVRRTASLYTRAILDRKPFSQVCSDEDALAILAASWRVPLDRWRGVVGVFIFVMVALVPTLHQRCDRPGSGIYSHIHTRFAKSILQIGFMNVSLVDWPACREMMGRSLRLQRWLRNGQPVE